MLTHILNPPIAWRYYLVYWRRRDGRTLYFRGTQRRKLFIANEKDDWISEESHARLFETQPEITDHRSFSKTMQTTLLPRMEIHYKGFDGIVLRSHLIIPEKTTRRRPPG